MDWRLIAALSSAGVSFCLVAAGAYVVLTSGPTQTHSYAPPPSLLTASKPANALGATVASVTPSSASRPAASRPTTGSAPARPAAAPSLAPSVAVPSPVVTSSVFAPTPMAATEDVAPSPFAPSPFAPNYALPPEPVVQPANIGVGGPPTLDLARQQDAPKPSLLRREPKHEHAAVPAGPKVASLTPSEVAPRHEPHPVVHEPSLHPAVHEPPPRPVVEMKKPTIVPEIHTAPPAARYQGVLTSAEIARVHRDLRLTPDQEPRWPPVEAALAEMGRQQILLIRHGQEPRISPNDWPPQRLYSIAGPLLMSLRPDQKDQVRRLCRSLGFEQVASLL